MIKSVEFDLTSGNKVTIFLSGTITVQTDREGQVYVLDGLHNNCGWKVKGSYQEVVQKIKMA